ncbi:cytochrome c, partial [Rhodoferax sp.]|uniref:c-type cytochrome n=1 Tax=Rhodoferax sp. TaxID=50421 RepID=UPI002639A31D
AVTLASTTPTVCTVSGTTLTLVAAGTCTLTADQAGNTGYAAAPQVVRSFTVAAAPVVVAPSATNGKVLYNTAFNGSSCASCHSTMPSLNLSKVLKGANSPSTILNAINQNKGGMGVLAGKLTTQNLDDIAAYLAQPTL